MAAISPNKVSIVVQDLETQWRWRHFECLNASSWHRILQLRAEVFVVEQNCPYCDPDQKDPQSWHLEGFINGQLIATCRSVPPAVSYKESSIGRVVVAPTCRGQRLGRAVMLRAIAFNSAMWPGDIRISGQAYLQDFYESMGFKTVRGPYPEDDIPHYEMLFSG